MDEALSRSNEVEELKMRIEGRGAPKR